MRRLIRFGVAAAFVLVLAIPAGALSAGGVDGGEPEGRATRHNFRRRSAIVRRRGAGRARAQAKGSLAITERGADRQGDYVELAREDTDKIFVVLAEFGESRTRLPVIPAAGAVRFDGPLHNEIPQPEPAVDNSTLWQADYAGPLRGHVLQPDGGVLRDAVLGPLLGRR